MTRIDRESWMTLTKWRTLGVKAVMGAFALFTVAGLLLPLRPTTSDLEKRELTAFPAFTAESFLDGSFFSQASLWYADTFPGRDVLVGAGQAMNGLFGVNTGTQFVGGATQADELPPVDAAQAGAADVADVPADAGDTQGEVTGGPVEAPTEAAMQEDIQNSIMEGLYVKDGAAYNLYYYYAEGVQSYVDAINLCARSVDEGVRIYSVLAPTNSVVLSDEELTSLGGTDQRQAMQYFWSLYDEGVTGIETWDAIRNHKDEYVVFRTDHHWTQRGAYYAYRNFCAAKGIEPIPLEERTAVTYEPFLGSFYGELLLPEMEANPDAVEAYLSNATNDLRFWDDGVEYQGNVVADATDWAVNNKETCFIEGDHALTQIDNPSITDGSTCLVVKDSFGCAFVPLLVDHYQTVYVIDFRPSTANIPDFIREHGVQDVIFVNNISIAGTERVGTALQAQMQ